MDSASHVSSFEEMTIRPERYLLDSNVFDKIEATPEALDLVSQLTNERKIQIVTTHIQDDELAAWGRRAAQANR
jgi:predicted patatin/cPLA2 family phospholipase